MNIMFKKLKKKLKTRLRNEKHEISYFKSCEIVLFERGETVGNISITLVM